jgi:hypothetical protein
MERVWRVLRQHPVAIEAVDREAAQQKAMGYMFHMVFFAAARGVRTITRAELGARRQKARKEGAKDAALAMKLRQRANEYRRQGRIDAGFELLHAADELASDPWPIDDDDPMIVERNEDSCTQLLS